MSVLMASPAPDQSAEIALLRSLLAALEDGDPRTIEIAQGKIFGLHQATVQLFVESRLRELPRAISEEVFANVALRISLVLRSVEKVRRAIREGTIGSLFFTIAKNELSEFWRERPRYKEDHRSAPADDPEAEAPVRLVHDPIDAIADDEAVGSIIAIVGGPGGFDGLLLELTVIAGLKLKEVEALLVSAERSASGLTNREAGALLGIDPQLVGQYLELIRECPGARVMSLNALKVAVHRARRRAAEDWSDGLCD
jgi:hypothetical protein